MPGNAFPIAQCLRQRPPRARLQQHTLPRPRFSQTSRAHSHTALPHIPNPHTLAHIPHAGRRPHAAALTAVGRHTHLLMLHVWPLATGHPPAITQSPALPSATPCSSLPTPPACPPPAPQQKEPSHTAPHQGARTGWYPPSLRPPSLPPFADTSAARTTIRPVHTAVQRLRLHGPPRTRAAALETYMMLTEAPSLPSSSRSAACMSAAFL